MKRTRDDEVIQKDTASSNAPLPAPPSPLASLVLAPLPAGLNDPTLDVFHVREFLSRPERDELWSTLVNQLKWNRVCYTSQRFGNACETPCWSNCYGGFDQVSPYQPMPACLLPLQRRMELALSTKFNIVLTRLYFGGEDHIAWHTDAREFLGRETCVASLSLGATRTFEMKRPRELWPEINKHEGENLGQGESDPQSKVKQPNSMVKSKEVNDKDKGKDKDKDKDSVYSWSLEGGDLFVMRGKTQQFWHHRVPPQRSRSGPQHARININFRYVLPEGKELAQRGHKTYYKYTVHGDSPFDPIVAKTYAQIEGEWKDMVKEVNKVTGNSAITDFFTRSKKGH